MYDLLDRPVDRLVAPDRAVLTAIRRWVHALTAAGLVAEGAEDPFGAAMRLIDSGSAEDLAIGRPCQPLVTDSEAMLIALWRQVAGGDAGTATATAALIVDQPRAAPLVRAIRASLA